MATITTPVGTAHPPTAGGGAFAGTAKLTRFLLRRDRVKLPAWIGGVTLMVVYVVAAGPPPDTEDQLAGVTTLFNDPVGRLMVGPGHGFDFPTHETLIANGYGLYFMLLAALMSILAVVRHTRQEEQSGRAELVLAGAVGPRAPLTAALVIAVIANVAVAVTTTAVMMGVGGFAMAGSALLGASVGAVGLAFAGVAAITVQVTQFARAAAGLAGAVLGVAFVLRSIGDMLREGGSTLSWLSPLGWGQQTAPFVLDRWWPLGLALVFAVLTTAAGYGLALHRDLGASLLSDRPGSPRARPALGTPLGLALRIQRANIIGWMAALAIGGLVYGAFADALREAADDMPQALLDAFGTESVLDGYLAYMARFMGFFVAAYAVMAVQGMRTEETRGRGEPVLATAMTRPTWLGANLAVTTAAAVAIIAVAGLATGVGAAAVTGEAEHISELTLAHLNQVPAVLAVLGVATLLFGRVPQFLPGTWAVVGYSLILGTFGPILKLPQLLMDLSPFEHPAQLPLEPFTATPLVVLLLVAVVTGAVGFAGYRRRDINT